MPVKNTLTGKTLDKAPQQYVAHFDNAAPCGTCSKPIHKGHYISWKRNVKGSARHINCANPTVWPYENIAQPASPTPTPMPDDDMDERCDLCDHRKGNHSANELKCPLNSDTHGYHPTHRFTNHSQTIPAPISEPTPDFGGDEVYSMVIQDELPSPTIPAKPVSNGNDGLLDLISERVESKVIDNVKRKVDAAMAVIDRTVQDKLDKLSIPSIELKRHELPTIKLHNVHKQFNDVLQLLNAGEYVYLHGSPGGHKSSIGPMLAEALGVRYGYMSLCEQTPEYVVKGFTSPIDGKFYESMFTDFYENGGLFGWEEMDAANDNLRASLNTMLENKQASLDKGMVNMHPKFYMLANGNTCGRGAHPAFPSRTGFDAAFAARFVFLEFQYDWDLCKHISLSINKQSGPIVSWAEKVSNWALANGVQLVMSPREVYKLSKLMVLTSIPDGVLLDGVLRGLDIPSKEKLLTNYPFPNITRG